MKILACRVIGIVLGAFIFEYVGAGTSMAMFLAGLVAYWLGKDAPRVEG